MKKNKQDGVEVNFFKTLILLLSILYFFNINNINLAYADGPVSITLLHTNDLHSHFRKEKTPLGLGGIARLKTAIQSIKESNPNTITVDGGDWSEGDIYYTLEAGVHNLRLMDQMGYDVAVLGNHDWINGPNVLLNSIKQAQPKLSLVAANVNLDNYDYRADFEKWILPYVIKEVGGLKIAFIGLSTYELIYDRFFAPIQLTEP